jgi:acyl-CoA reductase-like NAD-dependent aldehyde dehydrogenase
LDGSRSLPDRIDGMHEQKFIVGGEWRSGHSAADVIDPYSGEVLAAVFQASASDVDDAVRSAQNAFKSTSHASSMERSRILRSISVRLSERKEEFARTIMRESGKPITFARNEVDRAVSTFELASEETKRIVGETFPLDLTDAGKGRRAIVEYFPIGIILAITPFNFPLNLVAHKLAPAIASGNSFILKPPPQTPLTSILLGEVLLSAGVVPSAVNILPMDTTLAESLVADDRISMLSFTGSAAVGWMLKSKAAKKKIVLELGGNAAAVVDSTADIPFAVSRCILGAFGYAGQVCIKVQRILVHRSAADEFIRLFVAAAHAVVSGDPTDESTIVGPMISEKEALRVESWVNEAVRNGGRILAGGTRNGKFFAPTVLTGVSPSMKVCSEEVFGPVVTIEVFDSVADAVKTVNASRYGLQAGIFSNDHANIQYAYKHLNVGGVIVNDYPTFRVDHMPYGGVKDSGIGREGIRFAMLEMLEKKLLVL